MNKYPAFYEAKDGNIYLYQSKNRYFSYQMESWNKSDLADAHPDDTNITAEYLANTYGKVESKEHADFIVKLAKVNNINFIDRWHDGLLFCFYIGGKGNLLLDFMESGYLDDEKPITIPLPPRYLMESQKEWPQVGDEVLTKETSKATIIAIYERFAWIENFEGYLGMEIVAIEELKKPPTPVEELRAKVIAVMDNANTACAYADFISKAIINGEIEGLEYKPQ